jgi:ATP-dependent protease ClpP protease subunit
MARDEAEGRRPPPQCLTWPQISLVGELDKAMVDKFLCQLKQAEESGADICLEISTPGGDAELARRMVLEIEDARARMDQRFVFLGKTSVYSAGVTLMSAFPREDRYLTRDAVLMIHCRQLDKKVEISGPMRASLPKLVAVKQQIETSIRLEEHNFRRLVEGSDVSVDEVCERGLHNWYIPAEEALERGLIAAVIKAPQDAGRRHSHVVGQRGH